MCQLCDTFSPLASSADSRDTLPRVSTPTSDSSFLREKLWAIHQFQTTWTASTGHKELQKNRSLIEQWRIQDRFLSRRKGFSPENQNEWTVWKTTKILRYNTQTHAKNALRQYLRIIPHKMWKDFTIPGTEINTHTFTEMVSLGLVFASFAGVFFHFHSTNNK